MHDPAPFCLAGPTRVGLVPQAYAKARIFGYAPGSAAGTVSELSGFCWPKIPYCARRASLMLMACPGLLCDPLLCVEIKRGVRAGAYAGTGIVICALPVDPALDRGMASMRSCWLSLGLAPERRRRRGFRLPVREMPRPGCSLNLALAGTS
ncbi:hypothetical protein Tco_0566016 [Tanacetum coccineum]